MPAALLRSLLAHPLTAGLDLDDPATTELRKQIISSKPLLRAIYDEWYGMLASEVPNTGGSVLEIGSGAGYCERFIRGLITSEIFFCSNVRLVADAGRLPIRSDSLRAIVFTNVMHHMPDVRRFLAEASRCLRKGGKILMVEPWVTPWSRFIYTRLHHEPFSPDAASWSFPYTGPVSGANAALPWIVFARDRSRFESDFPEFEISRVRPFLPFRYLLSGGIGMRSLAPAFADSILSRVERLLEPLLPSLGMFAFVSVRKL